MLIGTLNKSHAISFFSRGSCHRCSSEIEASQALSIGHRKPSRLLISVPFLSELFTAHVQRPDLCSKRICASLLSTRVCIQDQQARIKFENGWGLQIIRYMTKQASALSFVTHISDIKQAITFRIITSHLRVSWQSMSNSN